MSYESKHHFLSLLTFLKYFLVAFYFQVVLNKMTRVPILEASNNLFITCPSIMFSISIIKWKVFLIWTLISFPFISLPIVKLVLMVLSPWFLFSRTLNHFFQFKCSSHHFILGIARLFIALHYMFTIQT